MNDDSDYPEQRTQDRVITSVPMQIMIPGNVQPIQIENRNLSWGGALLETNDLALCQSEKLVLQIPWKGAKTLFVQAEVIRYMKLPNEKMQIATRFTCLSCHDEARLQKLLQMIGRRSEQVFRRRPPQFMEILEVNFIDKSELESVLYQIATTGQVSLETFHHYRLDQTLLLVMSSDIKQQAIRLRARILTQKIIAIPYSHQSEIFQLTLRLEHPIEDLKHVRALYLN